MLSWDEEYFLYEFQRKRERPKDTWELFKELKTYLKDLCSLEGMLRVKPEIASPQRTTLLKKKINLITSELAIVFKQLPSERQQQAFIMFNNEKNKL